MYRWKAPKGTEVIFSFDTLGMVERPAALKARRDLCRQFGFKFIESGHFRLPLDDPRWPALLDAFDAARGRGVGVTAFWLEEPPVPPTDAHAWFELGTGATGFKSPARASARDHFLYGKVGHVASQRFLDAVAAEGLTGLAFLPLEEASPSDPMAWFQVYATHPLGRGLDHTLVDGNKWAKSKGKHFDVARRFVEPVAWLEHMRDDVEVEHPLFERVFRMGERKYFRIAGPRRFVREHLPPTDFAYSSWGWQDKQRAEGRYRNICCNARARAALIKAGVVKASRFEAMATVPAADADSEIYDRTIPHRLPPPAYTPEEAAAERKRREEIIRVRAKAGVERPRAPVFGTTEAAVRALETRLAAGTATWTPLRGDPEAMEAIRSSELIERVPEAWRMVLSMLPQAVEFDDKEDRFSIEIAVPEWNDLVDEMDEGDPEDGPSTRDLILGRTPFGDWYAVREGDPLLPGDARVVLWDHETLSVAEEWPNVAAFVAHLVWICDRAAGNG